MERGHILKDAHQIINAERVDQYGTPEDNFGCIAELWTNFLRGEVIFEPHDVAMMMALMKVARITTGAGKEDSYVDLCGYVALAADMKFPPECPSLERKDISETIEDIRADISKAGASLDYKMRDDVPAS